MNIAEMRDHALKNISKVIKSDTPVAAKWMKMSEESLKERGLLPERGQVIRVDQPNDTTFALIENREEGVFLYMHTTTLQVNGDTVTVH